MRRFLIDGSAQVPQNSAGETLDPAEARPAEQPTPDLKKCARAVRFGGCRE
jgi:hypothetical protein